MTYHLTDQAAQDLAEILDQSYDLFGEDRAVRTGLEFDRAMQWLGESPGLGHVREDLAPPGRNLRFWTVLRRFVIVYQPDTTPVEIVRILDGARDIGALLAE